MLQAMTRISVDVNDEWLEAAREILGTETKVATINEALHSFALRKQAKEIFDALDSVEMDFTGSEKSFRYGGGRDLRPESLAAKAREAKARDEKKAT
jgi:Arc/MetJ family transcription regulator